MIYESGRESSLLDDIQAGHKTVECRLNRGKFADYRSEAKLGALGIHFRLAQPSEIEGQA